MAQRAPGAEAAALTLWAPRTCEGRDRRKAESPQGQKARKQRIAARSSPREAPRCRLAGTNVQRGGLSPPPPRSPDESRSPELRSRPRAASRPARGPAPTARIRRSRRRPALPPPAPPPRPAARDPAGGGARCTCQSARHFRQPPPLPLGTPAGGGAFVRRSGCGDGRRSGRQRGGRGARRRRETERGGRRGGRGPRGERSGEQRPAPAPGVGRGGGTCRCRGRRGGRVTRQR